MTDDTGFDAFFPRQPMGPGAGQGEAIGIVVGGSLSHGLDVKVNQSTLLEGVTVGRYVIIEGEKLRYFGMITDIILDSTNPMLSKMPPDTSDPFIARVYRGTGAFGRLSVTPMLAWEQGQEDEPTPVKSLPAHFAPVVNATQEDVGRIFGQETDTKAFEVGEPVDMDGIKVYLDLGRFVERSSGVFGKSGTGKTFLTRLLLAGIVQQSAAVNLIFDMHNEYGWQSASEGGTNVKGLKQLFGERVAIFTLDEESSLRRGIRPDHVVQIGYEQIEPQDVEMLSDLLGLSEAALATVDALHQRWGNKWLSRLLALTSDEIDVLVKEHGQHSGTLAALKRRLGRLRRFAFLKPDARGATVQHILEYIEKGISVVLEFGRYGDSLAAYILVANFLTRRIRDSYVRQKERAQLDAGAEPLPLVITIEEAHKFLDPKIANHTVFGVIARELRKYNVTLLIVDQRPSGIDEEVMSQIGTRVTCLLDNERDVQAVLTGISGAGELRQVLARLDTRQQALLMGHAVKMPVVIRTRTYGTPEFYASLDVIEGDELQEKLADNIQAWGGDDSDGII
jgi:uncharacterized protein